MDTLPRSHEIEELSENPEPNLKEKHFLPSKKYSIEDDINKLFEAIEIGSSRLERRDHLSKRAMKRPMSVSPSSGIGISEPVSLKQALRGLCISQASEMAAVKKRMSRTSASSPVILSETGANKKLSRAVVVEPSDETSNRFDGKGKGNLLEISLVPERSFLNASQKVIESGNVLKDEASENVDALKQSVRLPEPEIKEEGIICDSEQIRTLNLTCSSSGTKSDHSITQNGQTKNHNLSSENVISSFNVENKLVKSSRKGLVSRQRPRTTPKLVKSKVVPKTTFVPEIASHYDQGNKSNRDNIHSKVAHQSPESLRISEFEETADTVKDCTISKSPGSNAIASIQNTDNKVAACRKTMNVITESRTKDEICQSSKSSIGEFSSSTTSYSEESHLSGSSRPHMSTNLRWEAINSVKEEHGNLSVRHFKLAKKIGGGDIGTVYLSELIGTSFLFALKVMDNEFLASKNKKTRAQAEKAILETLDHPFLPTLYAHFETKRFSCLVMDYCPGGDLHVLRQKQMMKSFPEKAVRFYAAEVLLALEYLHMLGVVYRDLKPENILVREDGHIMLSDFDLSLRCNVRPNPTLFRSTSPDLTKKMPSPCSNSSCIDPFCLFTPRFESSTRKLKSELANQIIPLPQIVVEPTDARSNSFVGTLEYLAPEIIKGEGHGSSVDWWTFGIFLYELLYGKTPFKGSSNEETISNVVSENLKFPQTPMASSHARDLMRKLLKKEPDNRLGCLKGATEIKQHPFFEGLNWALIRCETPPDMTKLLGTSSKSRKSQAEKNGLRDVVFDMF